MNLLEAFSLSPEPPPLAAFVGAGGKSGLMYRLASELAARGMRVLVTTTVMIYHPEVRNRPHHRLFIGPAEELLSGPRPPAGTVTVAAREEGAPEPVLPPGRSQGPASGASAGELSVPGVNRKLKGYSPEEVALLAARGFFDAVLAEADGSRHRPVKAPDPHEPVFPPGTTLTAGLIGLDCLEAPFGPETVHRPELFSGITGIRPGESIRPGHLADLTLSTEGLFRGAGSRTARFLVLNKCDTPRRAALGEAVVRELRNRGWREPVLLTSLLAGEPVHKKFTADYRPGIL